MTANGEARASVPRARSGVTIGTMVPGLRVSDLSGLAQTAEEHGYDAIFTPEAWGTESFALVTAFALATRRIAVGTSILPIANRSAALTGMGAATVDDASGGRHGCRPRGCQRIGRSPGEIDVCLSLSTCVTDDPGPARESARGMLAWYGNLPFYTRCSPRPALPPRLRRSLPPGSVFASVTPHCEAGSTAPTRGRPPT
jgi:alkanesulfonate monooxygenase SsuD/methylene tetrahydromethanopterin reductase-like flavin-dependent oxidoreductase (luciferase family)